MSEEHGVPTKKGGSGLIILALLMLVGAGGILFWRINAGQEETVVEEVRKPAPAPEPSEELAQPAPPPPPDEELEEDEEPKEEKKAQVGSSTGNSGCSGTCSGTASAELKAALRARGGQARSCYNKALRVNPMLEGKMTVAVRLSPSGRVCSASITTDTVGDPSVSSCVSQKFRAGSYPAPQGGCMDSSIPLSFVKGQ